jgi:hypothetical protein
MGILSKILGAVSAPFLGPLGPALIGAGSSLLGGALSNKAERKGIAAQNAYNDPAQIRARAEAAGFNPLLFIGPGVGNQTAAASGSYMGAALADAGMQIADQMSKNRELARLEKLTAENKKLAEKVQNLTIRPKVGGVYAQRQAMPSVRASTGRQNENPNSVLSRQLSSSGGVVADTGLTPLPQSLWIDSRREVDNKPITSNPGVIVTDNPLFGRIYSPTLDGDEPVTWYDYPTVAFNWAGSRVADRIRATYEFNEDQPKRPSIDRYDPWLLGVPSSYDHHKGRQRQGFGNLPQPRSQYKIAPFFDLGPDKLPKFDLRTGKPRYQLNSRFAQ